MVAYLIGALDIFIWGLICAAGIACSYFISEGIIQYLNKLRSRK